jgi:hypothetical protein
MVRRHALLLGLLEALLVALLGLSLFGLGVDPAFIELFRSLILT